MKKPKSEIQRLTIIALEAQIDALQAEMTGLRAEVKKLTEMSEAYLIAGVSWTGKWVNHRAEKAEGELAAERAECLEQARLNGMGAQREAALLGKIEIMKRALDKAGINL